MTTRRLALITSDGSAASHPDQRPHNGDYGVVLAFPGSPRRATRMGPSRAVVLLHEWLAGFRGNTADAYRRDLQHYLTWCEQARLDPLDPVETTRACVNRYLLDLENQGRTPATIARRLTALKGFYGYGVDEEHLQANPAARVTYAANAPKPGSEPSPPSNSRGCCRPPTPTPPAPPPSPGCWPPPAYGSARPAQPSSRTSSTPTTGPGSK